MKNIWLTLFKVGSFTHDVDVLFSKSPLIFSLTQNHNNNDEEDSHVYFTL